MKMILIFMFLLVFLSGFFGGCANLINPEVTNVEKFGRPVLTKEFRKDIDACYQEWESLQPGVTNVGGRLVLVEDPKVFKEKMNTGVWKCLQEQKGYKAKK